ncbi:MAG: hypothetical protein ACQETE_11815 [Bacteroidota bacterium]
MYPRLIKLAILLIVLFSLGCPSTWAQDAYEYGTVVGGEDKLIGSNNYLQENEEGYQITLINSSGGVSVRGSSSNRRGSQVQIINVPKDTDYLELLVYYANLNPRFIRKNKIKIYRVKDAGQPPYKSENIKRYWTEYNFQKQYDNGGPFDEVQPGDIIFVQRKGLINRPIFDPLNDLKFILTLPSLALSVFTVYNAFKK